MFLNIVVGLVIMNNTAIKSVLSVWFASVLFCSAVSVTVEWDPALTTVDGQALDNVSFYKVFYGEASGVYPDYVAVTNATSADLDLDYNKTYYISVKTYTPDAESDYAKELVWTAPLRAFASATVEWDPTLTTVDGQVLDNVTSYKVFYGVESGVYPNYAVVTNATSIQLNLEYNTTYYISVKSYTPDAESDYAPELVWTAPVMSDSDSDGISDDWEISHFGSLDVANATSDYDGNGVSDLIEFVGGTNPTDPLDAPGRTRVANGVVSFEARQATGYGYENRQRVYSLEYSPSLVSGSWSAVPGMDQIVAAGQIVEYPIPATSSGYYRIMISLE